MSAGSMPTCGYSDRESEQFQPAWTWPWRISARARPSISTGAPDGAMPGRDRVADPHGCADHGADAVGSRRGHHLAP